LAAAINQTIVYSIIEGNEGGEHLPDLYNLFSESSAKMMQKWHAIKCSMAVLIHTSPFSIYFNQNMVYSFTRNFSEKKKKKIDKIAGNVTLVFYELDIIVL